MKDEIDEFVDKLKKELKLDDSEVSAERIKQWMKKTPVDRLLEKHEMLDKIYKPDRKK